MQHSTQARHGRGGQCALPTLPTASSSTEPTVAADVLGLQLPSLNSRYVVAQGPEMVPVYVETVQGGDRQNCWCKDTVLQGYCVS